ncbi:MAG: hypothetical protein GWN09_00060 [Gammaproteobacteria bacterium]|nr:hypothetical protein [Gammaproteobacteria bacterium]
MRTVSGMTIRWGLAAALVLLASACATTLAPNYDKALVDGLTATNMKLMEHFAATSAGTASDTFDKRESTYNNLIGRLDALVIQARARPIPKNYVTEKVNAYLEKRGVQILDGGDTPSATALEKISGTMVKMRDTDKKQGVTPFEVAAFKGQVVIFMDQALTYETFLER